MTITIPGIRPGVLSEDAARRLEPYLAFRHRFRNLYLFDLEIDPIRRLLRDLPAVWSTTRTDLVSFSDFLLRLAEEAPS
jgi:hypothetical protein